jgi:hypothetical protein
VSGLDKARRRLIDALNEEHNPSYWGGEPRDAERLVNDFVEHLQTGAVHVVTENAGYDVGTVICGVFRTRQNAEGWVEAKRAEHASKIKEGRAPAWGAPAYDIEDHQLDPEVAP